MGISDKQLQILTFPYKPEYDAIICDGAIRSGKTSLMTVAFIDWAMREFNKAYFGICSKTVGTAVKNIIMPYMALKHAKDRYNITYRRSDKLLTVKTNDIVNYFYVYGGKDESSGALIQGITLSGIMLDEVVLMPRSFVEQALARCSVDGSKLWFSCNPASPIHWFYTEWVMQYEKKNALYVHFELTDNPSLTDKIIKRYQNQYNGVFFQRYILGLWVRAEGLIYDMFGEDCITDEDKTFDEYYLAIDYGTMNPFSASLWGIDYQTKQAVCVDEYYYNGRKEQKQKTDGDYYDDITEFVKDYNISKIIIDPSAASFITEIRKKGKFSIRAGNNAVVDGIRYTMGLLKLGHIKIHRRCKHGINEMYTYSWDEKAVEDAPIKENDHFCDGMRYFCYTVLRRVF